MHNNLSKSQNGFIALIGVIFFSAILGLMLFLRVERLAALRTQFGNAMGRAGNISAFLSCSAISTLLQPLSPAPSVGRSFSIDFSDTNPELSGLSAIATSCVITQNN